MSQPRFEEQGPAAARRDPGKFNTPAEVPGGTAALLGNEGGKAHVQEMPDPSRAEIAARYLRDDKSNDSTVGPPPQEELQAEQAQPEDKCSCNKSLPARVVKAIQAFLKGGPLTSDVSMYVPAYAKSVTDIQKAWATC
jgi:hypothetical protein